jgi:hypothetical protein
MLVSLAYSTERYLTSTFTIRRMTVYYALFSIPHNIVIIFCPNEKNLNKHFLTISSSFLPF